MMREFGGLCASARARGWQRLVRASLRPRWMCVHRCRGLRTIVRPDARAAICALRPFLAER
jgi:hypothetical protein